MSEAPTHGLLAKINSSYQNKNFQKLLVIIAKTKKGFFVQKKDCLLGEAMLVKALSFFARIKFINELAVDHFILLKGDNFDFQYPRISL